MSFKCDLCKKPVPNGTKIQKLVKYRPKQYFKSDGTTVTGKEIAVEKHACTGCVEKLKAKKRG